MNQTKRKNKFISSKKKNKFILSKRKKKINKKTHRKINKTKTLRKNINKTRRNKTNYGGSVGKSRLPPYKNMIIDAIGKYSVTKNTYVSNQKIDRYISHTYNKDVKDPTTKDAIKNALKRLKDSKIITQKKKSYSLNIPTKEYIPKLKPLLKKLKKKDKSDEQEIPEILNELKIKPGDKILDYNSSELFDLTVTTLNNTFGSHKIEASTKYGIKLPYDVFLGELKLYKDDKLDRKTKKRTIRKKFLELCSDFDKTSGGELNKLFSNLSFILNGGEDVKYNTDGTIMEYVLYPDNKLVTIATGGNIITIFAKIIKIIYGTSSMSGIIKHIDENDGVFNSFSDFDFALVPNIKSSEKTDDTSSKKTYDTSAKKNSGFVLTRVKLSTEFDDTKYIPNKNNSNKPIKLKQYIKKQKENETNKNKRIVEIKKTYFSPDSYNYNDDLNFLKKINVDSISSFSKYPKFCIECMKFYKNTKYFTSKELPHKSEFVQSRIKSYNEFADIHNNNIDFLHTYDFEGYGRHDCHNCKLLIDYLLAKQKQTAEQTKNNVNTIVNENIDNMKGDSSFIVMVKKLLGIQQLRDDDDTKRLFSIIHYIHTQNKRMNTYITGHSINKNTKDMNSIISYYKDLSTTYPLYPIMYDLCKDFIKHNTYFISKLNQIYNIVNKPDELKTYENKRIKFKVSNIRNIDNCSNIKSNIKNKINALPYRNITESNRYINDCFLDENNTERDLEYIQNIEFTASVIVLDKDNNVCELGFFDEDEDKDAPPRAHTSGPSSSSSSSSSSSLFQQPKPRIL